MIYNLYTKMAKKLLLLVLSRIPLKMRIFAFLLFAVCTRTVALHQVN